MSTKQGKNSHQNFAEKCCNWNQLNVTINQWFQPSQWTLIWRACGSMYKYTHTYIYLYILYSTYTYLFITSHISRPATPGHVVDRFSEGPTSVAWGPAAFGSILGYISPHSTNLRVSHPNATHPLPGFFRGDAPWVDSCVLDCSDRASLSTPAQVSTALKISDIRVGLKNQSVTQAEVKVKVVEFCAVWSGGFVHGQDYY